MKIFLFLLKLMVPILFYVCFAVSVAGQTTAFTYQGNLKDGATTANGNYDFQFALYDTISGGNQLGSTLSRNSLAVANGIFSVSLDFGSQFPGANRFLEIRVRLTGQPSLTTLTPRQSVNSAPYSVKSLNTDTASALNCTACVTAGQIASVNGASITGTIPAASIPTGSGSYIQNGTGVQTANQNISGNGFFGGQVAVGTTVPSTNVKLQIEAGNNYGLFATSTNEAAVSGVSTSGRGLYGQSSSNDAVIGFTDGINSSGVIGVNNGNGTNGKGVSGSSSVGTGVSGGSSSGRGVSGFSNSGTGVFGQSTSGLAGDFAGRVNVSGQVQIGTTSGGSSRLIVQNSGADAIFGLSTGGIGVSGFSDNGFGMYGSSTNGVGIRGASENDYGVRGSSTNTSGVFGRSGNVNAAGVYGDSLSSGTGVSGFSSSGIGVRGESTSGLAGDFTGRVNISGSLAIGTTVQGPTKLNVQGNGIDTAIFGQNSSGRGVYGRSESAAGVDGTSTSGTGVYGESSAVGATVAAVRGVNLASGGNGVIGQAGGGNGTGVYGVSTSATGYGVIGRNLSGGYAVYSDGNAVVLGFLDLTQLAAAGVNHICYNASSRLSVCSSSLRYKTNVDGFSQGMSFVNKLRPISYDWKDGGMHDVGFGAEDVANIDPRFVTYNDKGEVEGVKYDRLSVAFVNAFKEQQEQIEKQKTEVAEQKAVNQKLQSQIDNLTKIVCSLKPDADGCRQEEK